MKYLYGLSIQGIQSYIFSTNKLKEIIGASELVDLMPRTILENLIGDLDESKILIDAAGNLKYIFDEDEKTQCDMVFRNVPFYCYEMAGGITVSQAIVETDRLAPSDIDKLEELLKIQRNRTFVLPGLALMAMRKNPKTGLAAVDTVQSDGEVEFLDNEQVLKRARSSKKKKPDGTMPKESKMTQLFLKEAPNIKLTDDIENITSEKYENWIAVIHADGNGLGQRIVKLADRIKAEEEDVQSTFRDFSKNLQQATENAVKRAFDEVILPASYIMGKVPFRPIIIGGDDVTVITRGDLALDFTARFLAYFEEETSVYLKTSTGGLTACAGIAYTKSHYPFHYGVSLAEVLCKEAKKTSKSIHKTNAPSCLLFHKMFSSFVRKWEDIKESELKAGKVSFLNGPYFISEEAIKNNKKYTTVSALKKWAIQLSEPEAPKSNIRQWLSELGKDEIRAEDLMRRTEITTFPSYWNALNLDSQIPTPDKTHLFDALVIEDLISKE